MHLDIGQSCVHCSQMSQYLEQGYAKALQGIPQNCSSCILVGVTLLIPAANSMPLTSVVDILLMVPRQKLKGLNEEDITSNNI